MVKATVAVISGMALLSGCAIAPPPAPAAPPAAPAPPASMQAVAAEQRGVHSGAKEQIYWMTSLNPKCELVAYPEFIITVPPSHGTAVSEHGEQYPGFPKTNDRAVCNSQLAPATNLYYQSNPSFHGRDSMMMKVLTTGGTLKTVHIEIEVF